MMNVALRPTWSYKKLDELGFIGRGKSKHRPRDDPSLYGGKYPFIQTGEVKAANLYISHYSQTYNEKGLSQSKLWKPGTLLITIAANIAETAILKIEACFPDSIVGFIPDPKKADVRFVKYCMDTMKLRMQNVSKGTTQDNLSLDKLLTFDFLVPPLPTQSKIASILSAYDDLIENNTRRIKILEEMAQALYRDWFVKFRFPGHEKVKMVESELGMVPEGWKVKNLFDVADVTYGFPFKSKLFTEEQIGKPVIRIRDIKSQRSKTFTPEEPDSKYLLMNGDLLVGMDGDFHMGKWAGGEAYLNQRIVRFRPKNGISTYYLFLALKSPIEFFDETVVGTTVAHLSNEDLRTIYIVLPDTTISKKIMILFDALFKQELNLQIKNANLRRTRDLLLPKLISGEANVENFDII
jgi:type I restriction enzyme S subunit